MIPIVAGLLITSQSARAASSSWIGTTDANWATTTNWAGGVVPGATTGNSSDVATFNGVLAGGTNGGVNSPIVIDTARRLGDLVFDTSNAGAYQIGGTAGGVPGGNVLTLGHTNSGSGTVNITASATNSQIIAAPLQMVAYSSSNNPNYIFQNNSTTAGVTLSFLGAITANVSASRPTLLQLSGSNTGNNIISGNLSNPSFGQAVAILTKNGSGTWILSGNNVFSGSAVTVANPATGIQINAGVLVAEHNNALGNTANSVNNYINNGGTLELNSSGTNGSITLSGNLSIQLNSGGTIRSNGNNTTASILRSSTAAAVSGTIATVNATDVFTIGDGANDFTGGASDTIVHISGPGTVLLAQASNYVGQISVDAGTLQVGNATALGSGTTASIVFGANSTGKLQLSGNDVTVIGLNSNANLGSPVVSNSGTATGLNTLTVDTSTASSTYGGILRDGTTGILALAKSSAGTLTLNGSSSYSGGTAINGGILAVGNANALGSGTVGINSGGTLASGSLTALNSGAISVNTGGTLLASGSLTVGAAITVTDGGTLSLNNVATDRINSTGAITISGTGNLLNAGGITVSGSTYNLATAASITGTSILLTGLAVSNQTVALGTTGTFGRTTYAFSSTPTQLKLTVSGSAFSLTWNGGNANWNTTDANWQKDGAGSNITFVTGDKTTINTANTITVTGSGVTASSLLVNNASGTATLTGGAINVSGSMTKSGNGTLQVNNAINVTNGVAINSGTLVLGASGTLSSSAVGVNGGSLSIGANNKSLTNVSLTGGSIDGTGGVLTGLGNAYDLQAGSVTAILDGTSGVTKTGLGTVTLSGANLYSGTTSVIAGTLALSGSGSFGSSSLSVSGGVANLGGKSITNTLLALTGSGAVNNGTITNDSGNYDLQSGSVGASLAGSNGLNKTTVNTVALGGSNSFTGATTISAGVLRVDNTNALQSSAVTVSSSNGLAFGTGITSATVGSLSGAASIDLTNSDGNGVNLSQGANDASTTYSGVISGSGSLTKNGAGAFTLSGANTYAGGTQLTSGTLILNNGTALGSGTLTALNGTTISLITNAGTGANVASLSGSNAVVTILSNQASAGYGFNFTGTADQTVQISGANVVNLNNTTRQFANLSGTVNVLAGSSMSDRSSTTTWVNGGDNTFFIIDGNVTSRNGSGGGWALGALSGTGTLGMGGAGSNGINLTYTVGARNTDSTFAGKIQDGDTANAKLVNLVKTGTASLTLSGYSTFTGNVTVNGGTLIADASNNFVDPTSGALGASATTRNITINNTGTLKFNQGDTLGSTLSTALPNLVINAGGRVTNAGNNITTLGAVNLNGGILTGSGGGNADFQMYNLRGTVTVGGTSASTISGSGLNAGYHLAAPTTFNVAATGDPKSDLNVLAVLLDQDGGTSGFGHLGAAGSLTKTGTGTMTLSANNTYKGATNVDAGRLIVAGAINGSTVSVAAGAVLASGTVGTTSLISPTDVTSNAILLSGTLSPGTVGTIAPINFSLASGAKLNFAAGSSLLLDVAAANSSDRVNFVTLGDWLSGSGNAILALNGTVDYGSTYTVFANVSTAGFTFNSITGYDTANWLAQFNKVGNDYRLTFLAVPEPGTYAMLLSGFGVLMMFQRRRR